MPGVLVVEDDLAIRQMIMDILSEEGYRVTGAADGLEALGHLRNGEPHPALILLDLGMPRMDGRAFRAAQLADPAIAGIPVVVVSADRDVSRSAKALGAAGHLVKPLRLDDLIAVVARLCAGAC